MEDLRKIVIYPSYNRNGYSKEENQTIFAEVPLVLGSYWKFEKERITNKAGHGLTDKEIYYLLPSFVTPDAVTAKKAFWDAVDAFYHELTLEVSKKGTELCVSLSDDTKPLIYQQDGKEVFNQPIDANDYLMYRWLLKHPLVAGTKELANSHTQYHFYLHDTFLESAKILEYNSFLKQATVIYFDVIEQPDTLDTYLSLLGVNIKGLDNTSKQAALKNILNTKPESLVNLKKDPLITGKDFILKLVDYGLVVVPKNSSTYFIKEDNLEIGETFEQAARWVTDKKNNVRVAQLNAQLKEKKKN